jgi:RNA polymerase sigma factor (sigma-70 family)
MPFARLFPFVLVFFLSGVSLPRPVVAADPRIAAHAPLAKSVARKFVRRVGGMLDFEDLFSIAMTAMWEAAPLYDATRGPTFGQYAVSCMWSELRRQQLFVWRKSRRAWLEQNSIHQQDDDDRGIELPSRDPSQFALVSEKEISRELRRAVASLPRRQRAAIESLYWEEQTLVEAGDAAGVTKQAMEQRRNKALSLLAKGLETLHDDREGGGDHG